MWTARRVAVGAALAWIVGAPAIEAAGLAPTRAVRGWHMFHDVARHTCRWGLVDREGRPVGLVALDPVDRALFASFARADGAGDPEPLCARGWRPTLSCPDAGIWAPVQLAYDGSCR